MSEDTGKVLEAATKAVQQLLDDPTTDMKSEEFKSAYLALQKAKNVHFKLKY